jgi:hypothetical protein
MALRSKEYRETIYRLKSHPQVAPPSDFVDQRDSLTHLYFSLIPFVGLEYFVEFSYELPISGLVFPMGFLLYWAFYYTYYRPGFLEDHLSESRNRKNIWAEVPSLLLGVAIWFVKVSFVEFFHFLFIWMFSKPQKVKVHRRGHRPNLSREETAPPPFKSGVAPLPHEVMAALKVLGLGPCRDWNTIHHRYRDLAKRFHPDLNPDLTSAGSRFIMYDKAYRSLLAVKSKYFTEK